MKVDVEARKFVFAFLTVALFCGLTQSVIGFALIPVFIFLAGFSLYFFRDPERFPPPDEGLIISPADGVIAFTGEYEHPEFGRMARISVFMNVHNVHINRSPVDGVVKRSEYIEGGFKHAGRADALAVNERQIVTIETEKGPVIVTQIAGMVARRIVSRIKEGQKLERGERIGLIRFGSRVEVFLPIDKIAIIAQKGEKVRCGETPIARWQ
jgi:phosphatidylserine decarboxylase